MCGRVGAGGGKRGGSTCPAMRPIEGTSGERVGTVVLLRINASWLECMNPSMFKNDSRIIVWTRTGTGISPQPSGCAWLTTRMACLPTSHLSTVNPLVNWSRCDDLRLRWMLTDEMPPTEWFILPENLVLDVFNSAIIAGGDSSVNMDEVL